MSGRFQSKPRYWHEYTQAKIQEGNIFIHLSPDIENYWYADNSKARRGENQTYSDACIELILGIRFLFNVCIRGGLNPSPLGEDLSIVCEDGALQKKQPQPLRSKDSLSMDHEVSQTCFAWRGWSCIT